MSLTLFMYHRILPGTHPESIPVSTFRRQLDYLEKHYRILRAEEVEGYIAGTSDVRGDCAALSFDDAWVDNLLFATAVLRERGLSALLAVSAGCLHDGPVRKSVDEAVLFRSMSRAQEAARSGDASSYLNRAELAAMQESGCWRLEVHGCRHELGSGGASVLACPQNGMDGHAFMEFLAADLRQAREAVSALTGRKHRMLFWPWGHYSRPAVDMARRCGFDLQFTVEKGAIRRGDSRPVLPRVGVSPRWSKFVRNCIVFRHPLLAAAHDCFHRVRVRFDDRWEAAE